jgi:hypothetical protein
MAYEVTSAEVAARVAPARSYWLVTVSPAGAPHGSPGWGGWRA